MQQGNHILTEICQKWREKIYLDLSKLWKSSGLCRKYPIVADMWANTEDLSKLQGFVIDNFLDRKKSLGNLENGPIPNLIILLPKMYRITL